jgi:resuscitation-promoting factor RpfA
MLTSGNGRHRRPRQAPGAVVTAAATGAGIALPLLGTGAAHAADDSTWDKVAVCETGGLWSADTGDGFYGGLAITQDTWDAYGGDAYAKRPDLASRAQQIAVAEKILASIGPDAWPGCETSTGLRRDTAPPSVDPGDPGDTATPAPGATATAPSPSVPAPPVPSAPAYTPPPVPGAPAESAPGAPAYTAPATPPVTSAGPPAVTVPGAPPTAPPTTPGLPTPPAGGTTSAPGAPGTTPSAPSAPGATPGAPSVPAAPAAPTPGAPVTGKHGKPYSPTDEQLAAADRATRTEVYATTGDDAGTATPGTPSASTAPTSPAGTSTATDNNSGKTGTSSATTPDAYTVDRGDSLSGIAAAHHVDGGWQRLYDVNRHVVGGNPNLIKPGQILNLG